MKEELFEIERLRVSRGSVWPAIIGSIVGGLIGLVVLNFHLYIFVLVNTAVTGAILGSLYGRVSKKDTKTIAIGAIIGALCGLNPISFGVFVFGGICLSLWLRNQDLYSNWSGTAGGITLAGWVICSVLCIIYGIFARIGVGEWIFLIIGLIIGGFTIPLVVGFPFVNIPAAFVIGGVLGWFLGYRNNYYTVNLLSRPLFAVPLLSFAGYFIACKIEEIRISKKLVKEGGLLMSEEKILIPEVLNEQKIKKDLVFYREKGRKPLNSYLNHLVERFKTGQEIKTLQKWTEQLNMRTEFIRAAARVKRAQSEFYRVDTESEIEEEKLKTIRLQHRYKQKELQQKFENLDLENQHKRLELQKKIENLKKPIRPRESDIERIKRQESERALKIIERIKGITKKAEFLSDWKKKMKKEHPEEAEEIIDEVDRMMVEEDLKEE